MTLRIVIADDHEAFRRRLASRLEEERDFHVAGQADGGRAALALIEPGGPASPDLLLLDLDLRDVDGLALLPVLGQRHPGLRVVMLSSHDDPALVRAALAGGAMGFVSKDEPFHRLAGAIRDAATRPRQVSIVPGDPPTSGA